MPRFIFREQLNNYEGEYGEQMPGQRPFMKSLRFLVVAALLIVFSTATWKRSIVYDDRVELWADAVRSSPNKARTHDNLGYELKKNGRIAEALREFERAVQLDPDDPLALSNLATIYCSSGRRDECGRLLEKAVAVKPDYLDARYNLLMYYFDEGFLDEAAQHAAILEIRPASLEGAYAREILVQIQKQKLKHPHKKHRGPS